MKGLTGALGVCLLMTGFVHAQTPVTFQDFNPQDTTNNTVNVGGAQTNLTVARSGTGAVGDDYIYSITYANQSFDGDATLDTLTFDVRVKGHNGGSASTGVSGTYTSGYLGTATVATNNNALVQITNKSGGSSDGSLRVTWTIGNGSMDDGETVAFSLENFAVVTSKDFYRAAATNFTQAFVWEGGGNTHGTVIGEGTNLLAKSWSNNRTSENAYNFTEYPFLYVTSDNVSGASSWNNWGLEDIRFQVVVIKRTDVASVIMVQ